MFAGMEVQVDFEGKMEKSWHVMSIVWTGHMPPCYVVFMQKIEVNFEQLEYYQ